jgi:hypothetical protein
MKRKLKILGLTAGVAAILALAIVGTAAASNSPGTGVQTQNQGDECLCGQCLGGECVNVACEPNDYSYGHNYDHNYDHDYSSPGPHGS